jgi:hypothetical protein
VQRDQAANGIATERGLRALQASDELPPVICTRRGAYRQC